MAAARMERRLAADRGIPCSGRQVLLRAAGAAALPGQRQEVPQEQARLPAAERPEPERPAVVLPRAAVSHPGIAWSPAVVQPEPGGLPGARPRAQQDVPERRPAVAEPDGQLEALRARLAAVSGLLAALAGRRVP